MEVHLKYPEKNFIKNMKQAVNAGNIIHIEITKPKLVKLVKNTLTEFQSKNKTKLNVGFLIGLFRLTKYLAGHFYAEAAEYNYSFNENNNLKITYVKNT